MQEIAAIVPWRLAPGPDHGRMPGMNRVLPQPPMEAKQVRAIFEQQAARYDQHAVLEREVADRLLQRVSSQRRVPDRIVDLGCGSGYCAAQLKKLYRKSEVVCVDFALPMCRLAVKKSAFMRPLRVVCANVSSLPLAHRSADLLVANMSLQWAVDLPELFNGLRSVLRPGGMLLFSLPGTDSLLELRQASENAGIRDAVRNFPDMHDVGDALLIAGFREPVMDAERITLTYPGMPALWLELEALGAASYFHDFKVLQSQSELIAANFPGQRQPDVWPLSWEVVYGAAFGPEEGQPVRSGGVEMASFSVEALRNSRRR
jgi:malonyl-CoA O-methyltransferase